MLYLDIEFYNAMFETEYPKLDIHLDTLKDVEQDKIILFGHQNDWSAVPWGFQIK